MTNALTLNKLGLNLTTGGRRLAGSSYNFLGDSPYARMDRVDNFTATLPKILEPIITRVEGLQKAMTKIQIAFATVGNFFDQLTDFNVGQKPG